MPPQDAQARLEELKRKYGIAAPAPTPTIARPPAPGSGTPDDETLWESILEWVSKPGGMTTTALYEGLHGRNPLAGALQGFSPETRKYGGDITREMGMEGLPAAAAGFGVDLVADPLNLIPFTPIGKALKTGAKAGGALFTKGLERVPALQSLGEKTVPYFGLKGKYRDAAKIRDKALAYERSKAFEDATKRLLPLVPSDPTDLRTASTSALHAIERGDDALDPLAREVKKWGEEQQQLKLREGLLRPADPTAPGARGTVKENYVPHSGIQPQEFAGKPKPVSAFSTLKAAQEAGHTIDDNIISTIARQQAEDAQKIVRNKFVRDLTTDPEMATWVQRAETAPAGWVPFNVPMPETLKTIPLPGGGTASLADFRVHPMVKRDLDNLFKLSERTSQIGQAFDRVVNLWKTSATVVWPGFHARNLFSNIALNVAGDMSPVMVPTRYKEAAQWLTGGTLKGLPTLEEAKRLGAIGTEFGVVGDYGDATLRTLAEAGKKRVKIPGISQLTGKGVALDKNPLKVLAGAGRETGQGIEDLSRAALFIDQIRKGKTPQEAALHTAKWMIDYSAAAPADKTLGRLVPFFKWQRGVVPLIIETALTRPEIIASLSKAQAEIEALSPELASRGRPDYVERMGGIRLPILGDTGETLFLNSGLPGPDINVLPNVLRAHSGENLLRTTEDALKTIFGGINPAVKLGPELVANKNFFTGSQIGYPDLTSPRETALANLVTKLLGTDKVTLPASLSYSIEQMLPPLTGAGRIFGGAIGDRPVPSVGGLPLGSLRGLGSPFSVSAESLEQIRRRMLEDRRQQVRRLRGR